MAKSKDTLFFCKECGFESPKWSGKCPACGEWNTMVEAPQKNGTSAQGLTKKSSGGISKPCSINEDFSAPEERLVTGIGEFDLVLGGGIIKGSLVLIGGDPGIGKSTLLTQVCKAVSDKGHKTLYVSGEESLAQIRMRAKRLGSFTENMLVFSETDIGAIDCALEEEKPDVCVVDSIQTAYIKDLNGAAGSISQIRECAAALLSMAKNRQIATFVIGHVTKDGAVAGPRLLEHMVDTVLYFEGDEYGAYRVLRSTKNRFGSTNEVGVFEMTENGLREVSNPSKFMLEGRPVGCPGSVVTCLFEGSRPILAEVQALASKSVLANPRRVSTGIDYNRMNMLATVLEKRIGIRLSDSDAYVNIVGGIRVNETGTDLAVVIALASSAMDFTVADDVIFLGEVGLTGEIRAVSRTEERIKEAAKMGFKGCVLSRLSARQIKNADISLYGVSNINEAIALARGTFDTKGGT